MIHPAEVLKQNNWAALKNLGQNFLVNTHSLQDLEQFLNNSKITLEIGAGLGSVTRFLLEKKFSVHVCELDRSFAAYLEKEFSTLLSVTEGDFLKIDVQVWQEKNISQLIGNLPFYITSPIIQKVVKEMPFIDKAVFGVQWEVAQRICLQANNSFAIFLNSCGSTKLISKIKRQSFYPVPQVDGAWFFWQREKFVHINELEKILRGAFWGKRKSLQNSFLKNPFWQKDPQGEYWRTLLKKKLPLTIKNLLEKRPDQLNKNDYQIILFYFLQKEKQNNFSTNESFS